MRLRELLDVESGMNDGLALPAVVLMLSLLDSAGRSVGTTLFELTLGVVLGVCIPYLIIRLAEPWFQPLSKTYEPLNAFAIGLLVLGLSYLTHANLFLAAFSAGIVIRTFSPSMHKQFQSFGESISQLLKLAALLIFGALISVPILLSLSVWSYVFAVLALIAVRPLVIELVLFRSKLSWQERAIAAWFGPKGFSSIFYALLVLRHGIPEDRHVFHIIAIVIVLSIIAHSSTDVALVKWFKRSKSQAQPHRDASSGSGDGGAGEHAPT